MREIVITQAEPRDCVEIFDCIKKALADTEVPFPDPLEGDALEWIFGVLRNGYAVVARDGSDRRIVGSLGVGPQYFSWNRKAYFLQDAWFYVEPAYRRGGTAIRLIQKAQEAATRFNVPLIMTITTSLDADLKDRFYRQRRLKYAGGVFYCLPGEG